MPITINKPNIITESQERLLKLIQRDYNLTYKESIVLALYPLLSYQSIGELKMFGVSREAVRQVYCNACNKVAGVTQSQSWKQRYIDLKDQNIVKNDNDSLSLKICDLDFIKRTKNCLSRRGVEFVGDLVVYMECDLIKFPNFGYKCLVDVQRALSEHDLHLGMCTMGWRRPVEK